MFDSEGEVYLTGNGTYFKMPPSIASNYLEDMYFELANNNDVISDANFLNILDI